MERGEKMKFFYKLFLVMTFFIGILMFSTPKCLAAGLSINSVPDKTNVEPTKVWTIKFNQAVDRNTINKSNIYIKDSYGNKFNDFNVQLQQDNKSVTVSPLRPYAAGQTYSLEINNNVKAQNGGAIISPVTMKFTTASNSSTATGYIIVIDAGNGGSDFGVVAPDGTKEKDINLSVAKKVGNYLTSKGVKVIYTRSDDSYVDLSTRRNIANSSNANAYVSIQCNTAGSTATGVETYYISSNSSDANLANNVQNAVVGATTLTNRGVKTLDSIAELDGINIPCIKIPIAFLSNSSDENYLINNQDAIASGISTGILNTLKSIDGTSQIKSISAISAYVVQNTTYSFPTKVQAVMTDGSTRSVDVVWNSTSLDTSKPGTYTFSGTVSNYLGKVALSVTVSAKAGYTIAIDAGHGGPDPGAIGVTGVKEKDVNLSIALKVGQLLSQNNINVVYTRTDDNVPWSDGTSADLQHRSDIANNAKADYYVCIHNNSFSSPSAYGTETLYQTTSTASEKLAQAIQSALASELNSYDRGIKDGDWLYISRHNNMPTVLTEVGFLTNPTEEENLNDTTYQAKAADAIVKGILSFLKSQ